MRIANTPLIPDPDEAREWLEQELSGQRYQEAKPTWFDNLAHAVTQWFNELIGGLVGAGGGGALFTIVIAVVVIALLVVAFIIWGRPRWNDRSRVDTDLLFGEDAGRSAAELRADAAERAASGDWVAAIVLRFRGLAKDLADRGAVTVGPGATVHAFAVQATAAFPAQASALTVTADVFDAVRYLRQPGTEQAYIDVCALDDSLAGTRPTALAPIGSAA